MRRGRSPKRPAATPITRCLPKRSSDGRCRLFAKLLPRHLEIIYEINRRFLDDVRHALSRRRSAAPAGFADRRGRRQIHTHGAPCERGQPRDQRRRRAPYRASEATVLHDFHRVSPEKFFNVTNGVTPRRWIALSNPKLSALITRHIGDRWLANLEDELRRLEPLAGDPNFQMDWQAVKADNKRALARLIKERTDIVVDPQSLFDIQVKRLHEYKRQHLNVLYLVTLYNRLRRSPGGVLTPRTVIFGGKAAPGYRMAKLIIKLINSVARIINQDPLVSQVLKVAFLPDFNVKNGQRVYPAADLSEQISTAGKEASGTGNMKFAMNGAITIGTLDGANVEIREAVGTREFLLVRPDRRGGRTTQGGGLHAAQHLRIESRAARGDRPHQFGVLLGRRSRTVPAARRLAAHPRRLHAPGRLSGLRGMPRARQPGVSQIAMPGRACPFSIARESGRFSSDRSIREYCRDIWKVTPIVFDERRAGCGP